MRETALILFIWLSAAAFLWTFGSVYFVIVIALPPALDPIGILRTILLAPGYLSYFVGGTLAALGLSVNPWTGAAIIALALSALAALLAIRVVAEA